MNIELQKIMRQAKEYSKLIQDSSYILNYDAGNYQIFPGIPNDHDENILVAEFYNGKQID